MSETVFSLASRNHLFDPGSDTVMVQYFQIPSSVYRWLSLGSLSWGCDGSGFHGTSAATLFANGCGQENKHKHLAITCCLASL